MATLRTSTRIPFNRAWLLGHNILEREPISIKRVSTERTHSIDILRGVFETGLASPPIGSRDLCHKNLGIMAGFDSSFNHLGSFLVALPMLGPNRWNRTALGSYLGFYQSIHANNTIEIKSDPDQFDKLAIYERISSMATEDRIMAARQMRSYSRTLNSFASYGEEEIAMEIGKSRYTYTLQRQTSEGAEAFLGIDVGDTRNITISSGGQVVFYIDSTGDRITLPGTLFYDNFGAPLLQNYRTGMTSPDNIYQSDFYTSQTSAFSPRFIVHEGEIKLLVHRATKYMIDKPEEVSALEHDYPTMTHYKIFPTTAYSAVEIEYSQWDPQISQIARRTTWVPLNHGIGIGTFMPDSSFVDIFDMTYRMHQDIIPLHILVKFPFAYAHLLGSQHLRFPYLSSEYIKWMLSGKP